MSVFIASIEVRALPGSHLAELGDIGAFVYCYIPADSQKAALNQLGAALTVDRYEIAELEYLAPMDCMRWETPEAELAARELCAEARATGRLVYSTFHSYPAEEN